MLTSNNSFKGGDIQLVVTDDYLSPGLSEIAQSARSKQQKLILLNPFYDELFIGPLFTGIENACYECFRARLSANRNLENYLTFYNKKRVDKHLGYTVKAAAYYWR